MSFTDIMVPPYSNDGGHTMSISPAVPFKYRESEIVQELYDYLASTYQGHYMGEDNIQSVDLIFASGHGEGFCIGNIIKYATRQGKKKGHERADILKILHYAIFLLFLYEKKELRKLKNGST